MLQVGLGGSLGGEANAFPGRADIIIIKLNNSGTLQWGENNMGHLLLASLVEITQDGIVVQEFQLRITSYIYLAQQTGAIGEANANPGSYDAFIMRLDLNGTQGMGYSTWNSD